MGIKEEDERNEIKWIIKIRQIYLIPGSVYEKRITLLP